MAEERSGKKDNAEEPRPRRFEAIGALGYGRNYAPENYQHIQTTVDDQGKVWQIAAVARSPWFGIEGGFLRLPPYHSRSHTSDYPAYRGLPAGTYPQTVDGAQEIEARARYARMNLYYPGSQLSPYAFYGRARVTTDNYEHPVYNQTDPQFFRQHLVRNAPYFGAGLQYELSPRSFLRAEYGRIPHGTVDPHTLDRNYDLLTLGAGVRF